MRTRLKDAPLFVLVSICDVCVPVARHICCMDSSGDRLQKAGDDLKMTDVI